MYLIVHTWTQEIDRRPRLGGARLSFEHGQAAESAEHLPAGLSELWLERRCCGCAQSHRPIL